VELAEGEVDAVVLGVMQVAERVLLAHEAVGKTGKVKPGRVLADVLQIQRVSV